MNDTKKCKTLDDVIADIVTQYYRKRDKLGKFEGSVNEHGALRFDFMTHDLASKFVLLGMLACGLEV